MTQEQEIRAKALEIAMRMFEFFPASTRERMFDNINTKEEETFSERVVRRAKDIEKFLNGINE